MTAITVSAMIEALSKLPPEAKLVVTESGYYSYGEFADIMLPEAYTAYSEEFKGEVVYKIGHSHQSY
jgi:hypothetical protein